MFFIFSALRKLTELCHWIEILGSSSVSKITKSHGVCGFIDTWGDSPVDMVPGAGCCPSILQLPSWSCWSVKFCPCLVTSAMSEFLQAASSIFRSSRMPGHLRRLWWGPALCWAAVGSFQGPPCTSRSSQVTELGSAHSREPALKDPVFALLPNNGHRVSRTR